MLTSVGDVTAVSANSLDLYVVRNEVDPAHAYHCDAIAANLPTATEIDFVAGDRVPLSTADGVVLTGSTVGVYEADTRPWITKQEAFVRKLIERDIPTLGVCFGHQVVNSALGGTVEHVGTTARLVEATLADDPLFDGVSSVVVSLHGDVVTELGEGLTVIASADHAPIFGTRHRSAPLWTVQFHPEITAAHRSTLVDNFDWEDGEFTFADSTPGRILTNFRSLVADATR